MLLRLLGNLLRRAPAPAEPPAAPADSGVAALLQEAEACRADGNADGAIALCGQAIALDPCNLLARQILIHASMPGDTYHDILRRIHQHLRPCTYVEIGVFKGETMAMAAPETLAIGLDPEPDIRYPLTARTRIFAETSDDFFAHRDLAAELGGLPVDLAFIDGMHHFEFALRDFINLERYCTGDSTILIHDCYPLDEMTSRRERVFNFWSGDVWKLVLCLKKYRPDLSVHTVHCAPTGLAIIRNLDPASTVLAASLDEICEEFIALPFATIAERKAEMLNAYSNKWGRVCALLGRT